MIKRGRKWRNWSGSVSATPRTVFNPIHIEEVVEAVNLCRKENRTLRVLGSGYSFTPIAASDDALLSLDRMQGILHVDREANTATIWAGTKLKMLGELLHSEGMAQENLGDVDAHSIAGAIGTGTHGSGLAFGNISTQVIGLTVVTGSGEVIDCTERSHPELFKALQLSLGVLGVIVQVTLRLRPSYRLRCESERAPLSTCLEKMEALASTNRNFEFHWFPFAESCYIYTMNETEEHAAERSISGYLKDVWLGNSLFGTLPTLGERVDQSHLAFAKKRLVRCYEMEYNLPVESLRIVIKEMRERMALENYGAHLPIKCGFVKGDSIWLSPAYGRDSAYIAVRLPRGKLNERYVEDMERIFLRHGGRPHWGKLHSLRARQFKIAYPMWNSFLETRKWMDPDGIFLSPYLRELFFDELED
ncbi:D-arabinono-1,4-lactone oxidase [Cohnella terricola]|uniref:FAD-binding protein n=1 Tax=Cohnella terricola TaxID=1289167 RepID=A0A559JSW0_9BACL|nr:D-arabinono-1,4-lactone oxidase [Cohnella terricola]TVY02947.1 FAD-binding protein [Cohnella terricola]